MTGQPRIADRTIEDLGEDECLRLIAPGGVGRVIALTALPSRAPGVTGGEHPLCA
jgi:hypothetical protein